MSPAISKSRRSSAGIALIAGGAFVLLAIVLPLVGTIPVASWLSVLAYLAFAVALAILAIGSVANNVARYSLFAGALGWLLLVLVSLAPLPGEARMLGLVLAGAGGVVGAIVLYTGKELSRDASIGFLAFAVVAALFLLNVATGYLAALGLVLVFLFGAAGVIAGVLLRRVQRKR